MCVSFRRLVLFLGMSEACWQQRSHVATNERYTARPARNKGKPGYGARRGWHRHDCVLEVAPHGIPQQESLQVCDSNSSAPQQ